MSKGEIIFTEGGNEEVMPILLQLWWHSMVG